MEGSECYICKVKLSDAGISVSSPTKYSMKPIHEVLETICGFSVYNTTSFVCQSCGEMIYEYDEFYSKAIEIQEKLCNLIADSQNVVVKAEVEEFSAVKEEDPEEPQGIEVFYYEDPVANVKNEDEVDDMEPEDRFGMNYTSSILKQCLKAPLKQKNEVYKCEICFRNFNGRYKLLAHQNYHKTDRNYICQTCTKTFKTKACLRMHQKVHTNYRVFCDHCDLTFTKKSSFARHYISKHTDRKEYLCTNCPKAFSSMSTLRHHQYTHMEERKEVCEICSGRFHTKAKLKRHMRMHSAVKEFSCPICGKLFSQKYNVNAHIKTIHAEDREARKKEFFCNICGMGRFSSLLLLQKHLASVHEVVNETLEEDFKRLYKIQ